MGSPELLEVAPPQHVTTLAYPSNEVTFAAGKTRARPGYFVFRVKREMAKDRVGRILCQSPVR